jgi:hypothetical protein
MAVGIAPGGVREKRRPLRVAHAKSHQRATVVEVDAHPVPADGAVAKNGGRPFVIEPGTAAGRLALAVEDQRASHLQLWPADVVAGQVRRVAFA